MSEKNVQTLSFHMILYIYIHIYIYIYIYIYKILFIKKIAELGIKEYFDDYTVEYAI